MDKVVTHNNDNNGNDGPKHTNESPSSSALNPLVEKPLPAWYKLYKRLKLFPWWIRYNIGLAQEAVLKDKIIQKLD